MPIARKLWLPLLLLLIAFSGLRARPLAYDQALREAWRLQQADLPAPAAQRAAQAAALAPWRSDLWEQAGHWALEGADYAAALTYFERAAATPPVTAGAPSGLSMAGWLALGQAYQRLGQDDAALRAWDVGNALYGPHPDFVSRTAQMRLQSGSLRAAADDLRRLADLRPTDALTWYRLGLVLAAYQPAEAPGPLDRAAALDPAYAPTAAVMRRALLSVQRGDDPAYTLLAVGRALAGLGEWGMAYQALGRATVLRPDMADAWAYLGEALQHPGQGSLLALQPPPPGAALEALERGVQLDPHSLAARSLLAVFWTRQGRPDRAADLLAEAVSADRANPALHIQLAQAQAAAGDLVAADAAYQQALALAPLDPTYRAYWIEHLLQYYSQQVNDVALPAARQMVLDYPDHPAALATMGRVLLTLNDQATAGRFLRRALAVDPDYAPAALYLGQLYLLQGERAQAQAYLRHALALEPYSPVGAMAQRLLESLGR